MKRHACGRAWEAEAVHDGRLSAADVARHERHAALCHECRELRVQLSRLRHVARATPAPALSPLQVRRLRASLLQSAALPRVERRLSWMRPAAVVATCLCIMAVVVSRTRQRPKALSSVISRAVEAQLKPYPQSTIEALGVVHWSRRTSPIEETITLREGALDVRVPSQHHGHRFRLITPDGEIEVWGTRFVVVVHSGQTQRLDVHEGIVAWRRPDATQLVFRAGEAWTPAPVASRAPAPSVEQSAARPERTTAAVENRPTMRSRVMVEPATMPPAPAPSVFAQAVQAMDRGDFAVAAQTFRQFTMQSPNDDRVEDASYLRIVALTRVGRSADAEQAATDFLARFPQALRRWEAALVVARAARSRDDCASINRVLQEFASDSRRSSTAASLRTGCAR